MPIDLTEALASLRQRRSDARTLLEDGLSRAASPEAVSVFIRMFTDEARRAATTADEAARQGRPLTLGGLAVSVKDLFDVAGHPTTAGSTALADAPPAREDAEAVARLRRAGAALLGHTNLSEFAFSGVGINPHHGTPVNPVTRAIDGRDRIPGGSTSGGAVSVAIGAAWAALGTDTGGSLRIPAALQGLVGFKPTARLIPQRGCIPLSPSLDTVGAISRSVRDAALLHSVLSGRPSALAERPLADFRLAVASEFMQDNLDPAIAARFERSLRRLAAAGARIETVSLPALTRVTDLQAGGGLTAAESWAWHHERLARRGDLYDPRVALRIRRGEAITPDALAALHRLRRDWIAELTQALDGIDAVLSPTLPIPAPEIAPLLSSDDLFFDTNARLLRNTAVVNLLDGCALSLPDHAPGEAPTGLMLWAPALRDDTLLAASAACEAALRAPTDLAGGPLMRVAIIGAGLSGVTCAYELALQGHEVQVFERDTSVATGASFAPPGLIAPGLMAARPDWRMAWRGAPSQLGWRWARWRARRAAGQSALPEALHQLALRGQAVMAVWRRELKMEVEREAGVLLLWRTAKDYKAAAPLLARLQERQVPHRELDADGCRAVEPGLNPDTPLHGGIHLTQDEAANARQFSQALKQEAQRLGVRWHFNVEVLRIEPGERPSLQLASGSPVTVDAVIVCAGKGAAGLLAPHKLKLPWGTVQSHTLTAPLRILEAHPDLGPRSTVVDMSLGVTLTRLGQRVRVGGAQELGGTTAQPDGQSMGSLHQASHDWFPGALLAGGQQRWKATRLELPDELPLIGASGLPGVWLNIGHGDWGWTLAGGAAQLLSARLGGRDAGLDVTLLEPGRLR